MEVLAKPIIRRREFRQLIKTYAQLMGFSHPWKISIAHHDIKKKDWPSEDHGVYCCIMPQPQYHRCEVHTDLRHPGWEKETSVEECIRHELAHAVVSGYTCAATNHINNKQISSMLDLEEDKLVNWIATMPIWDE